MNNVENIIKNYNNLSKKEINSLFYINGYISTPFINKHIIYAD